MEINFYITEDAINSMDIAEYEAFERAQDGDVKIYRLRPAMCRFMVDINNQPIPFAQALKLTEKLKVAQIKEFVGKFFAVMQEKATPKTRENSSQSLSDQKAAVSEFQDGVTP